MIKGIRYRLNNDLDVQKLGDNAFAVYCNKCDLLMYELFSGWKCYHCSVFISTDKMLEILRQEQKNIFKK